MMRSHLSIAIGVLLTSAIALDYGCGQVSAAPQSHEGSIKNVRDAGNRVRTAALDVITDVEQRKGAEITGDPRFLFTSDSKERDSKAWAQENQDLGPLEAPRKKWLDADIAHLDKWVGVLQSSVSDLIRANKQKTGMEAASAKMSKTMNDLQDHLNKLHTLGAGPNYNNLAIGKAAFVIYDDVAALEDPWKSSISPVAAK